MDEVITKIKGEGYMHLYNTDCLIGMKDMAAEGKKVDTVITSPPYNISLTKGKAYALRYRGYEDNMENEDYVTWMVEVINTADTVLNKNGSFLLNIGYGNNNNETVWLLIAEIIKNTNFTIADQIVWKKNSAFPNNVSSNKLTRIFENVFVLVRKSEYMTFHSNKKVVSTRGNGQKMYENMFNFIEAANNDKGYDKQGHKATFSTDLVGKLLDIYGKDSVLDMFMGTGTTGVECKRRGLDFYGIELSEKYFEVAKQRIDSEVTSPILF